MFWRKESTETQLDRTITQLELDIQMTPDMDAKTIGKKVKVLGDLYTLRSKNVAKTIDPNTVLICLTNLLGILFIIGYEHAHVIPGKAIGFVGRALK